MSKYVLPPGVRAAYHKAGIRLIRARDEGDAQRPAIHLYRPTMWALYETLERAERDLFLTVVIHDDSTWPMTGEGQQEALEVRERQAATRARLDAEMSAYMALRRRDAFRVIQGGAA